MCMYFMYVPYVCAICKSLMAWIWMTMPVFRKEHDRVLSVLFVLSD